MDSGLILFRFPCPAEFLVPEQGGNPAELLEAQQFLRIHPQIFEYPRIRHARLRQLLDNIGHEGDIMRSPGTVVPDGGSHAVSKRLVDYGHRHHATLPFVNIAVSLHDLAAVEPVHDFIGPVLSL